MAPVVIRYTEGPPDEQVQTTIFSLYEAIFGEKPKPKVAQRLAQMPDMLILIAYVKETPIGYKIGYAASETCFYSWIGGVLPAFRGHGIAAALMDAQHTWCHDKGYTHIKTKTLNRWREMLLLNLKKGFEITETFQGEDGQLRIVLVKKLIDT